MSTLAQKKKIDAAYIIKSLIGVAIMILFRFIPAPDPITPVGMSVIGQFIGMIFLIPRREKLLAKFKKEKANAPASAE